MDRDYISPLILAANNGDLNIIKILIENGSNVNQTDRFGATACKWN